MVYCPECGAEITSEDIFCGNCGIALTPLVPVGEDIMSAPISEDEARDAAASPDVPSEKNDQTAPDKTAENATNYQSAPSRTQNSKVEKSDENILDRVNEEWMTPPVSVKSPAPLAENLDKINVSEENFKADKPESKKSSEVSTGLEDEENPLSFSGDLSGTKAEDFADQKSQHEDFDLGNFGNNFENHPPQSPPVSSLPQTTDENSQTSGSDKKEISGAALVNNFSSDDKNIAAENVIPGVEQKISPTENDNQNINQDFQATIPYTPTDFTEQKIVAAKIADENILEEAEPVKLSPSDAEKFAVSENSAPITPPEMPVGSTPHGSLEPTSISVQIYDPKQKTEDAEPPTLLSSPDEVKAIVEQAKTEQARESRSYTNQNMVGSDTDGKSKAKLKPLDEGTVLNNRYEVVRKIGGGGMGAVYLASDKNLGGISRAVKEMVQSYIEDSQQEKAVNDFRRESMLLTSLEHPSIPTIFDYFFDEKEARFYLVMKYISGGDLAARLRAAGEGKIDEAIVTEWGIQLADVLDYLHNRQPPIVYRDLKPSNIMIDGNNGKVMLIDFGIARWVNKEEKGVTAVGTMGYAPPELFSGNVEPRSDIYSLGSTMFHLLTGADPQSNPLLIFDFNKHPRPRQINSRLTDQMEQILMKMVEYTAAKRFTSAAELKEVLISHLDNLKKGRVTVGVAGIQGAGAPAANQPVFCGFCGQKILAADVFCPFCGAQQASAAGQSAPAAQPQATARLVIVGTNELDSPIFKLEKDDNLVGRRDPMSNIFPEVDLSKFDPQTKISRRHARIWRDRDSFLVEDLGSSNGTILISKINESQKLGRNQPRALTNGDKIRVGDTTLHFVCD